jgi:hypothetical protein
MVISEYSTVEDLVFALNLVVLLNVSHAVLAELDRRDLIVVAKYLVVHNHGRRIVPYYDPGRVVSEDAILFNL